MTTALSDHDPLFDLPTLPERLLALADEFICHNDALGEVSTADVRAAALRQHIPSTHALAARALEVRESVERMLRSTPAVVDASLRLQEIAFLSTGAVDELLGALSLVRAGKDGADNRIHMAANLTALGAATSVDLAETLAVEMRRQRVPLTGEAAPQLSSKDVTALRAVARGKAHITLMLGRQYITAEDGSTKVSTTTVRSLESRFLLHRGGEPQESVPQRLRLTASGMRTLAGTFGQAPPPAQGLQGGPSLPQPPSESVKRSR
ncbi:hypothetical protein ACFVRD_27005 [Streptomyces sp. NPDC057908]|uniref:hypothetical protein n=1 Tax=Streptomyces sp. NPDC057908 TaxID=3346276 RepID=UPI0036EC3C56